MQNAGQEQSRHDARITFIVKVLAECSQHFTLASEMRAKLVKYCRLAPRTTNHEGRVGVHCGQGGASVEQQRTAANATIQTGQTRTPADRNPDSPTASTFNLSGVDTGPIDPNQNFEVNLSASDAPPHDSTTESDMGFIDPMNMESDSYDYFMSASFQDWFFPS